MLARVAENLYWIGRNLERAEHCNRYLLVQYYSTLDAPMLQNKDFTLRSILFMSGSDFDVEQIPDERDVLRKVLFDVNNPNSILTIIRNARENARSIRNVLSTELWEAINKWFLFAKQYRMESFDSSNIYEFSNNMQFQIALIKSNKANSMLHDDVWHFINLGRFIECTQQVIRILRSKISDWTILSNNGVNTAVMQYQWTIVLKSLEAFDAHNNYNRGIRSRGTIFKFILSNPIFPRSVLFTLNKIASHLSRISVKPEEFEEVATNLDRIIEEHSIFSAFDEEDMVVEYLESISKAVANLHVEISNMYFK